MRFARAMSLSVCATALLGCTDSGADVDALNREAVEVVDAWLAADEGADATEIGEELGKIQVEAIAAGGLLDACLLVGRIEAEQSLGLDAAICDVELDDVDERLYGSFVVATALYGAASPDNAAQLSEVVESPTSFDDMQRFIFEGTDVYDEVADLADLISVDVDG